jgi:hypothetical protein
VEGMCGESGDFSTVLDEMLGGHQHGGGSNACAMKSMDQTKWRLAKARPDPVFKYFSKAVALIWVANSNDTIKRQGRYCAVC